MEEKKKLTVSRESLREALQIFEFVRPYRLQFFTGLALLFVGSSIFLVFPKIIGDMLDVAQGKAAMSGLNLKQIGALLIGILIFQGIVSYFRVMMFAQVSERGTADIRVAVYEKLIHLPIVFFEKSRVGELVSRITNDVEKLYNTFYFVLAEFLRQIIILVGGIAVLMWESGQLALVMLATFPIIIIGAMFFGRWVRKLSKIRQDKLGESNTILDETLQTIHAVKAFTNEKFEANRYSNSNHDVVKISMKYAKGRAVFAVFIITMLFGALFFVIGYGMWMVQQQAGLPDSPEKFTAGKLISFVTYTAIIGAAIASLGNFYAELVGAVGATERVREILKTPTETAGRPQKNLPAGRFRGEVEFENIHFSYPTRADVEVLKGVSLKIEAGSKVALVGQSGSGKSTMMQLLLQFHLPSGGSITMDGRDIHDYDLQQYRSNFAIVPQEVILFGGSIRENILYGRPDADEAAIIAAAKKANAWDFIKKFPEGLETIVGERGIKLSGGQRQRIAIARAILRDPAVLLLDEATSSLDAESEKVVQEALENLMENRTSIIIAHRLATIREVDQIYVLENGKIVEQGRHDELSERESGAYAALAKLQFDFA